METISVHAIRYSKAYDTTRHQAIVDFISELQMVDGGFIDNLMEPRSAALLKASKWATLVMSVLDELSAIDEASLISFVVDCEEVDGGFTTSPWETPVDYGTVNGAVETLYHLNALDSINQEATTNWVMDCYRTSDGGFNSQPSSYSSLIWPLYNDIATLNCLGELGRINSALTNQYTLGYYDSDGSVAGFSVTFEGTRSPSGTINGVSVLHHLGTIGLVSADAIENYLMGFYEDDGSFAGELAHTYSAILSLELLGRLNQVNATLTTEFVLSCQTPMHGGFVNIPSDIDNPVREQLMRCYAAVEILRALGTLDALGESFTVQEAPVWTGDNTPPTPYTPPVTPPLGPEFWAGVTLVAVAGGVFAVVVFYGFTRTCKRFHVDASITFALTAIQTPFSVMCDR